MTPETSGALKYYSACRTTAERTKGCLRNAAQKLQKFFSIRQSVKEVNCQRGGGNHKRK